MNYQLMKSLEIIGMGAITHDDLKDILIYREHFGELTIKIIANYVKYDKKPFKYAIHAYVEKECFFGMLKKKKLDMYQVVETQTIGEFKSTYESIKMLYEKI